MKRILTFLVFTGTLSWAYGQAGLGRPVFFDSIQYVSPQELAKGNDEPAYFGDGRGGPRNTVVVEGVVCPMHPGYYGLSKTSRKSTILFSKDGMGRWRGLEVMADPSLVGAVDLAALITATKFYDNFIPGFTVKCKGELGNYQGNTQLYLVAEETEVTNLNKTEITPLVMAIDSFKNALGEDQYLTGEPYEQVYVEFQNVTVVNRSEWSAGRWNWSIKDANGLTLDIRDFSGYFRGDNNTDSAIANQSTWEPPAEGTTLKYIRGFITQDSRVGYQLAPLVPTDIGLGDVVPAIISNIETSPSIPTSSDAIAVMATIIDDKGVTSAEVYYAVGYDSETWKSVAMTQVNGDDWSGSIPAQANGSIIKVYIKAIDSENNESYGPDQTGKGVLVKVIDGGLRKISDIQMSPKVDGGSIFHNKTLDGIVLNAVVTGTVNYLGITTIQDGTSPFSGIFIKSQAGDGLVQLRRGNLISITKATVVEEFGVTYLTNISYTKSDGTDLPPAIKGLPIDSFQRPNPFAEGYEGMFLEFENVVVADTAPDYPSFFGEFSIATDLGMGTPALRVDDFSPYIELDFATDSVSVGQELAFLRGIMYFSFSNWKMLPRDKNDIAGYKTKYPESVAEINKLLGVKVFPNPSDNIVTVVCQNGCTGTGKLTLLDITGRVLRQDTMTEGAGQVEVHDLHSGMYYLVFSQGAHTTTVPVMVP
ncbi:MAG: T9SS type A sorting domain-containing protein [Bacteroidetes bacterium]|jgi:hypothetical protein|nr:T9SS type A sorting domain-containing protein [Bacteroidota bacterium]